jgi:protein SCO1/2
MRLGLALALAVGFAQPAPAHDGVAHPTTTEAAAHEAGPALPFPIEITPRFALTDQTGRAVSQADFAGRPMAIFFGYANCEAICSVALPSLAAALDLLGPEGADIAPILITVDPARDTPAAMAEALAQYHPRLIGLTGSEASLAEARAVFQVEAKQVAETPEGAPLYAHGSFIYLVGRDGMVKSLLPPILSPERMAELMRKYF